MNFRAKRVVVKIGSSALLDARGDLDLLLMKRIARQIDLLENQGVKVALVSSGAVVSGKNLLKKQYDVDEKSPAKKVSIQALASIGQPLLHEAWSRAFNFRAIRRPTAQVLFGEKPQGHGDVVLELMDKGYIPIINANDSTNSYETEQLLQEADNDKLATDVALAIDAEILFFLTDVDGVRNAKGKMLSFIHSKKSDADYKIVLEEASAAGRGGMISKLRWARYFAEKNKVAVIANVKQQGVIVKFVANHSRKNIGTEVRNSL